MNPLMLDSAVDHRSALTALSVNVNKVALLRNSRHLSIPSVVRAAQCCLEAGCQGITIHPRPDERHIRAADVGEIAALMKQWPQAEFNIEGNPFHNLMDLVRTVRPHQATFVPDSVDQFTSDHGWNLPADSQRLRPLIEECHALGVRVSLFMDPWPQAMVHAREVGADRVELYTEGYARAHAESLGVSDAPALAQSLAAYAAAAQAALQAGLGVNAGHDLNRDNLTEFLRAVPGVAEVSIGHALVADALELGYAATVHAFLQAIRAATNGVGSWGGGVSGGSASRART
ncbi:MAG: pyridoxine 5'-phosphate synthase [Betaproteobacteria bacterium]|nr:pyridoxine 5'-phosphate synthase [Betaproteobacteria bacterium]